MTMKKYRETIAAGGMLEIEHPASFFTLLRAVSPLNVEFLKDYRVADRAEQMVAGLWFEPEVEFDRVRLWNEESYEVTVEFLLSKGRSGLQQIPQSQNVVVELGNMLASEVATSPYFDLGEDWANATVSLLFMGTASAGQFMQIQCLGNGKPARPALGRGFNGIAQSNTSASTVQLSSYMPSDRLVRAWFQNGATVQSATSYMNLVINKP